MREYCEIHGPEFLKPKRPKRKEPFTHGEVKAVLTLKYTHKRVVEENSELWVTLRALIYVLYQSGFRKAEVSVPNARKWGKRHLSRASIVFKIGGKVYDNPSPHLLASMKEGDFVIITPPPSKADQFGAVWGSSPV